MLFCDEESGHSCGKASRGCYARRDMKRLQLKPPAKQQGNRQAKQDIFLMGVRCGSVAAKELIKSGWKNLEKLPDEVVSRISDK
jgi:hypothetical protein